MTNNVAEAREQLKSITAYVRDCQARIMKGEIMDLRGLDQSVIEVCNDVTKLPENESAKLDAEMSMLIEELETLAASIREKHGDALAAEEAS